METCPVELRKKLKIDVSMGAFYVDDPSDVQLEYLLSRNLVTADAVEHIKTWREITPDSVSNEIVR
jgi:hypothetical protein